MNQRQPHGVGEPHVVRQPHFVGPPQVVRQTHVERQYHIVRQLCVVIKINAYLLKQILGYDLRQINQRQFYIVRQSLVGR